MKQGWELKKFEELIQENQIGLIKSAKEQGNDKPFRYLKMDSITADNNLVHNKYVFVDATNDELKKFTLKDGDFLFNTRNSYELVGKTCVFSSIDQDPTLFNNNIMRVVFKKGILSRFINYAFSSEQVKVRLQKFKSGTTSVVGIYYNGLRNLEIPLPPLPEQKRIVAILDEAFVAIAKAKANAEKNLKNAKELFERYLQGVFENGNWKKKELRDITTVLGDGLHGTPKYTVDGDYYFINGNNLKDGIIELKESTKRVNVGEFNKHKKNLTDRTVLVSINGTLANVAFYKGEKIILGKSACYFNLKEDVDKSFVRYVLSSPYFIQYAHKEATGATIKNVSLKSMREFKVPLPIINEQQTIVRQLDALRAETLKLESIYQKKINDLEELKKSILQKAFAGELKTVKAVEV
jgi:type I restriction enzyme S subunit